jgi:glycosyltransferase involved in cell wall biosynthesis
MKNKPILCWHIGYIPDFNLNETETTYGSEIALVYLSEIFARDYRVLIFGSYLFNETTINGVEYVNSIKFEDFQKNNSIEIIILSRYINPVIDYNLKAKKIFILIQDVFLLPYYQGLTIQNQARGLFKNVIHKIDGIVTLTNWNKNTFVNQYDIDPDKVFIIGNAIKTDKFKGDIPKQKNKFIWTSHAGRGIDKLLEYFHIVKKRIPDAELYIYRDKTSFAQWSLDEMEKYDYFHFGGKIHNDKIIEEFQSSEMWFYPTDFTESCCISSLEAQMSKCVCVTSHYAGLIETVADRGVLIKEPIWSEDYKDKIINNVVKILNDEKLKKKYQDAGYKWAKTQSWENKAKEWYEMFKQFD